MSLIRSIDSLPMDKVMHALVGAGIASLLFPLSPILAGPLAVAAGVVKELLDKRSGKQPDWVDAQVTAAGGAAAIAWHRLAVPHILPFVGL